MKKNDLCLKLVINNHVDYRRAIVYALRSLYQTGFDEWDDLIVVIGGCRQADEHGPEYLYLPLSAKIDVRCVVIRTSQDNYDFHGYNMLYKYKEHDLIIGDAYMYLLDTIEFMPEFPSVFKNLPFWDSDYNAFSHNLPSCNMLCFTREVIDIYKDMYSFDEGRNLMSKRHAVEIEYGNICPVGGRTILNVTKINGVKTKWLKGGEVSMHNCLDIYGLGNGRGRGWKQFPSFAVLKFIRFHSCRRDVPHDFKVEERHEEGRKK